MGRSAITRYELKTLADFANDKSSEEDYCRLEEILENIQKEAKDKASLGFYSAEWKLPYLKKLSQIHIVNFFKKAFPKCLINLKDSGDYYLEIS